LIAIVGVPSYHGRIKINYGNYMTTMQFTRLRRAEASHYLKNTWGISRTVGTLAKLAVVGGGPKFQYAGRTPLYPEAELDAWAVSILSPLKNSTSDIGGK
jgi:hypothetical protein